MTNGYVAPNNQDTMLVVNPANGEVKMMTTKKSEEIKQPKVVAAFAKNTRYSIYNNGGGYTGL